MGPLCEHTVTCVLGVWHLHGEGATGPPPPPPLRLTTAVVLYIATHARYPMAAEDEAKSYATGESALTDMLELEHVIGYTGRAPANLHCHPKRVREFVCRCVYTQSGNGQQRNAVVVVS